MNSAGRIPEQRAEMERQPPLRARLWLSVGVAALSLGVAPQALAADTPSDGTQIEEVVVTAQRRAENIQDVPVSVQAVSAAQIQREGVKQTADLARITPNVTIALPSGEGSQPNITIRGIGLNDYNSNNAGPNGVYVDDVYISAPAAQTFGLFDVQQIQVLKGPQGTLYGRNTSGGALVFTSRRPTDSLSADVHAEYSSFNTYQIQAGVGGPIADGLTGRLAFVVNHSDGFMKNLDTGDHENGTDNQAVRLQLQYAPTDDLKVSLISSYGHLDNSPAQYKHYGAFVPGTQGLPEPTMCTRQQIYAGGCVSLFGYGTERGFYEGRYQDFGNLKTENSVNALRADYKMGPVTLTSITAFQYSSRHHPEETDAGPTDGLSIVFNVKSDTWTQEFRAEYAEGPLTVVAGAYYLGEVLKQDQLINVLRDGDLYGGFGVPPGAGNFDGIASVSRSKGRQETDSYAVFGQADYKLGDFTLTAGGRYTREKKTFEYFRTQQLQAGGLGNFAPISLFITNDRELKDSNVTWRAALSYKPTDDVLLYSSASTGFKSGGFNGGFLSDDPAQAAFQLSPIKPEKVTAFEAGFKSSFFDRRLIVNGAAFYNDYRDQQVFVTVQQLLDSAAGPILQLVSTLANADKSYTKGVELQITATPIRGLVLNVQPAWLKTEVKRAGVPTLGGVVGLDGNQLANAPKFSLFASAGYTVELANDSDVEFQVSSSYRSSQYFDATNDPFIKEPSYWIHNASVTYHHKDGWDVGAFVRNLGGEKYFVAAFNQSAPFGDFDGIVGAPRSYGVEFNYHF